MKKKYFTPNAELIVLTHENFLMSSVDGGLGDLGNITIISDSIVDSDAMDLMLF